MITYVCVPLAGPTVTAVLPLSDLGVGLVLLAASLVLLSLCLVAIVRTLSSLLKGDYTMNLL